MGTVLVAVFPLVVARYLEGHPAIISSAEAEIRPTYAVDVDRRHDGTNHIERLYNRSVGRASDELLPFPMPFELNPEHASFSHRTQGFGVHP
jgi:hypothetical protein